MTENEKNYIHNYLKGLNSTDLKEIQPMIDGLIETKANKERRNALKKVLNSMNNFVQKYGALYLTLNGIGIEITDEVVFSIPSDDLDTISIRDSSKKGLTSEQCRDILGM